MTIYKEAELPNTIKVENNGRTYKIICDVETIYAKILLMGDKFKPDVFVNQYENEAIAEDEYLDNLKWFRKDFDKFISEDNLKKLINKAPKKKDGGLAKGRLIDRIGCNNSVFIVTWADSWIYQAVTAKSSGADQITLELGKFSDTPRPDKEEE